MKRFVIVIILAALAFTVQAQEKKTGHTIKLGNYEYVIAEEVAAKADKEAARIAGTKVVGRYTAVQDSLVIGAYTFYCYDYNEALGGGVYELESGYTRTEKAALLDKFNSGITQEKFKLKGLMVEAKHLGVITVYQLDKYDKWTKHKEEQRKRQADEMNKRLESLLTFDL